MEEAKPTRNRLQRTETGWEEMEWWIWRHRGLKFRTYCVGEGVRGGSGGGAARGDGDGGGRRMAGGGYIGRQERSLFWDVVCK